MQYSTNEDLNAYVSDKVERMFFYADRIKKAAEYPEFHQDLAGVFSAATDDERMFNMMDLREKLAWRMAAFVTLESGELFVPEQGV